MLKDALIPFDISYNTAICFSKVVTKIEKVNVEVDYLIILLRNHVMSSNSILSVFIGGVNEI